MFHTVPNHLTQTETRHLFCKKSCPWRTHANNSRNHSFRFSPEYPPSLKLNLSGSGGLPHGQLSLPPAAGHADSRSDTAGSYEWNSILSLPWYKASGWSSGEIYAMNDVWWGNASYWLHMHFCHFNTLQRYGSMLGARYCSRMLSARAACQAWEATTNTTTTATSKNTLFVLLFFNSALYDMSDLTHFNRLPLQGRCIYDHTQ